MSTQNNNNTSTIITSNIFASYNSEKVAKALEVAESAERKSAYETMGVNLKNYQTMESALKISGLDFEVMKKPVYFNINADMKTEDGKTMPPKFIKVPDRMMTVREDTQQAFGLVSKDYEILQNREAFDFLDSMASEGGKFETAGLFKRNGAASYVTMSTEPFKILDDEFDPYILIVNGHDGGQSVRICYTPIRCVCRNSTVLALKRAQNIITVQHSKKMWDRLEVAREVMLQNTRYMEELNKTAEELAVKKFSKEAYEALCHKLFPVNAEDSEVVQIRNLVQIEQLMKAYKENDLSNFSGSAWQAIQSVADFESHPIQFRKAKKEAQNGTPEFQVVVTGMPLLNKVFQMVNETV